MFLNWLQASEQSNWTGCLPLPWIDERFYALVKSTFFSALHLLSGYWHVSLSEDVKANTALVTLGGGGCGGVCLWQWKVLPVELISALVIFQRLMNGILQWLHWNTFFLYLNDIIITRLEFETQIERPEEVFQHLLVRQGYICKPNPEVINQLESSFFQLGSAPHRMVWNCRKHWSRATRKWEYVCSLKRCHHRKFPSNLLVFGWEGTPPVVGMNSKK